MFEPNDQFAGLFFDSRDASKTYEFIKQASRKIEDNDFPSAENVVAGYARCFEMLGEAIE